MDDTTRPVRPTIYTRARRFVQARRNFAVLIGAALFIGAMLLVMQWFDANFCANGECQRGLWRR